LSIDSSNTATTSRSSTTSHLNPAARFVEGDVADPVAVSTALDGAEVLFHQAALGAVARSLVDPLATDRVNVHGTLTVLKEAVDRGVRRVVYASSSSVYGGETPPPTAETSALSPKSPYAVSKLAAEHYAQVFARLFDIETVCLRYFNVYGPRQRADTQYAAVVPLFIDALLSEQPPTVFGDGLQSRDFTFVDDAVDANLAAAAAPEHACSGNVYNVAGGTSYALLDLLDTVESILGTTASPVFAEPRPGDIRHSGADLTAARRDLGYQPRVSLREGLERAVEWSRQRSMAARNERS
jgi:UDP-N-acetylglucosamine/UDP-N-acetyl-alpha-D-glucosaminouronate 4-epimerase